jgi:hypothetical protein
MTRRRWLIVAVGVAAIFTARWMMRPNIDLRLIGDWKHVDDIEWRDPNDEPPPASQPISGSGWTISTLNMVRGRNVDPLQIRLSANGSAVVFGRVQSLGTLLPVTWRVDGDRLIIPPAGSRYTSQLDRLWMQLERGWSRFSRTAEPDSHYRILKMTATELRIQEIDPVSGRPAGHIGIYKRIAEGESEKLSWDPEDE